MPTKQNEERLAKTLEKGLNNVVLVMGPGSPLTARGRLEKLPDGMDGSRNCSVRRVGWKPEINAETVGLKNEN